ncbi:aldolase/citrate lyase family protein [Natrialba sp. INN-245]|uniref:HpcH/HpaI aldolase family protein n=1 Tax=Natrialba sp. INN-245 TaxID=2690967 RepID=UPI001310E36A|nr:aldolase/citrate lyase family protein [Natrialba sp. INN-245]MWV39619.1 hypothetical protein [Natrialba sp. INN-245]
MREDNGLLDREKPLVGASGMLFSKPVFEIYAEYDLDYLFLDFEHNGHSIWDSKQLEDITRTVENTQIEPIVRVPSGNALGLTGLISKVLDSGIRNIVVPRVRTPSEVRTLVKATKFSHENQPGMRGISAGRGSRWGGNLNSEWTEQEDSSCNLGVMVENTEAIENLDEIVAIDGLEFVLIGANDLSADLEIPLNHSSDKFEEAINQIAECCNTNNTPFGLLGGNLEKRREFLNQGSSFFHIGSDIGFIRSTLDDLSGRV